MDFARVFLPSKYYTTKESPSRTDYDDDHQPSHHHHDHKTERRSKKVTEVEVAEEKQVRRIIDPNVSINARCSVSL